MELKIKQWSECATEHSCPMEIKNLASTPCVNGKADIYPCNKVDLLSFVSLDSLGVSGDGNDIWGWIDPVDGREYAIFGGYDGTSFIDVSDPTNPSVLGFLKTHTYGSSWRDIKVYKDHAFIVSEAKNHGMQVFDLTQLRSLSRRPIFFINDTSANAVPQLKETAFYGEFGNCHNIVINEDTGFAYGVGTGTCKSGLHIINIQDPINPGFVGCYSEDGYVHDAQCVVYAGPDVPFVGREICFNFDEDTLTIVDVEDKQNLVTISRTAYPQNYYTHQGWLLDGHATLLLDDELDELQGTNPYTRTLIWDITSLKSPRRIGEFHSTERSIDHNLYVVGNQAFQANYCAGLRILNLNQAANGILSEVGFFDVAPQCATTSFLGSWSNYPYFKSGTIVVSSIERGLFVLKQQ
jgi:choice-of-anchor B domain-containing protein